LYTVAPRTGSCHTLHCHTRFGCRLRTGTPTAAPCAFTVTGWLPFTFIAPGSRSHSSPVYSLGCCHAFYTPRHHACNAHTFYPVLRFRVCAAVHARLRAYAPTFTYTPPRFCTVVAPVVLVYGWLLPTPHCHRTPSPLPAVLPHVTCSSVHTCTISLRIWFRCGLVTSWLVLVVTLPADLYAGSVYYAFCGYGWTHTLPHLPHICHGYCQVTLPTVYIRYLALCSSPLVALPRLLPQLHTTPLPVLPVTVYTPVSWIHAHCLPVTPVRWVPTYRAHHVTCLGYARACHLLRLRIYPRVWVVPLRYVYYTRGLPRIPLPRYFILGCVYMVLIRLPLRWLLVRGSGLPRTLLLPLPLPMVYAPAGCAAHPRYHVPPLRLWLLPTGSFFTHGYITRFGYTFRYIHSSTARFAYAFTPLHAHHTALVYTPAHTAHTRFCTFRFARSALPGSTLHTVTLQLPHFPGWVTWFDLRYSRYCTHSLRVHCGYRHSPPPGYRVPAGLPLFTLRFRFFTTRVTTVACTVVPDFAAPRAIGLRI